jgi:BCD family chlorophyll transporter-like MFS transporter
MSSPTRRLVARWAQLGPRFLPFADAATPQLPLPRLLRLSLFQVSVGMALVLLVGTLNRVMIVELQVPAALVAVMVALPVLYAPLRALIGFRSDTHRSALGWRRVPFIWMGTLIQFGGFAVMPFALLVLSGGGESQQSPAWIGPLGAGLCFLLVGAGLHTTQTAGLALATDLAPEDAQPRVVGLMSVMLLVGTMASAFVFGALLRDFSPGRLVQVLQAAALATMVLNTVALWKQEARRPPRGAVAATPRPAFGDAWRHYIAVPGTRIRLHAIALGALAFGMQDVLLEPYGGQVLGMSVGATTWLTATLAAGGLAGFSIASAVLSSARAADPARVALLGALLAVPAFGAAIGAAVTASVPLFAIGVFGIGLGAGLFGHGTLTLTMNRAPAEQAGLALGVWGAVQATAAGAGVALGGLGRDAVQALASRGVFGEALAVPATGYAAVYAVEMILLLATVAVLMLLRSQPRPAAAAHAPHPPHQWSVP